MVGEAMGGFGELLADCEVFYRRGVGAVAVGNREGPGGELNEIFVHVKKVIIIIIDSCRQEIFKLVDEIFLFLGYWGFKCCER